MPLYMNSEPFQQVDNAAFERILPPGAAAVHAGIYACVACGAEISLAAGHVLPPQHPHIHKPWQGQVRWRLVAAANHHPTPS